MTIGFAQNAKFVGIICEVFDGRQKKWVGKFLTFFEISADYNGLSFR